MSLGDRTKVLGGAPALEDGDASEPKNRMRNQKQEV
jgi:hypothetical protein